MNPKANNFIDVAIFGFQPRSFFGLGAFTFETLVLLTWELLARGFRHGAFGLRLLAWVFDSGLLNWVFWLLAWGFIFGRFALLLIHRAKCTNLQAKHCNALLDL